MIMPIAGMILVELMVKIPKRAVECSVLLGAREARFMGISGEHRAILRGTPLSSSPPFALRSKDLVPFWTRQARSSGKRALRSPGFTIDRTQA
jgi:hypothetical protein